MLIVAVVLCVAFSAILPLMTVVNYSVQDIISPERRVFVGTEWFKAVMRDDDLIGALSIQAVDGDAMPPADLSAEHPEVARRLTREFLALYETTDRLMRENRVFPIHAGARTP